VRILGSCGLAAIALGLPMQGAAQTALQVKEQRTLSYPRAIGRVEVDREGVLSITAPSSRSLRLTAIGEGAATVSVYGGDGGLMAREPVSVTPDAAASAPIVRAGEQVVAVDVQFAAVSATTLKALGFNFSKLSGDIQGAIVSPSSLGALRSIPMGWRWRRARRSRTPSTCSFRRPIEGSGRC